jgi:hypothetical protein
MYLNYVNISVKLGTGYGWTAGVRFPVGARDFSLLHSVQTSFGAYPAYPVGTGGSFLGVKAARVLLG